MNVFEKPTTSHSYSLYEDDLRESELLPKLSSTVGKIIALGETILNIENDDDFMTLKDKIDEMLPDTDQRLKTVIVIRSSLLYLQGMYSMHMHNDTQ